MPGEAHPRTLGSSSEQHDDLNWPGPLLLIADGDATSAALFELLRQHRAKGDACEHLQTLREAEEYLRLHAVDLILLDLSLRDAHGLGVLRRAREAASSAAIVVLLDSDDQRMFEAVLQEGAHDYLVKAGLESGALVRAMRYALERRTLQESLSLAKEHTRLTLDCIGDGIICTDGSGVVTFVNRVAQSMCGWSLTEATGQLLRDVFQATASIESGPTSEGGAEAGDDRPPDAPRNALLVSRDGRSIPIEESVAPLRDHSGTQIGAVTVFRDVTKARAITREIAHSAQHDFLTGLPNRMLLNERIRHAISMSARHEKNIAVLFLDLDGFKHINDSLGHAVGDKLLQSIAKRLVSCVRRTDTVSRQGGDEFVVLLWRIQHWGQAAQAAERMLRAVAEIHRLVPHDLHITTSIGVSVYPQDGRDPETLIRNADTAMYQAKENGRQSYRFFEQEMNVRAVERQSIEESLRVAIERQELALHYQPKIELKSGRIMGAEALLRWNHPRRGLVLPAQFILVAEDCGLIRSLGRWVLHEACRQARAWLDAGLSFGTVAINVSALEFRDDHFLQGVIEVLSQTGLPPNLLELELTESVLMKHVESTAATLEALKRIGVQVAVDDFGTGYSSLSYLAKFDVDALKIDQSFIRQIGTGRDTAIVSAVINMARSLKLRVVAEGVETGEELAFLEAQQCDEGQGYYFSRALEAEKFARLVAH